MLWVTSQQRTKAAREALQTAHALMIAQADKISDPKTRASFLTIEGNREIARVYENMVDGRQ